MKYCDKLLEREKIQPVTEQEFLKNLQARICKVSITKVAMVSYSRIHFSLEKLSLLVRQRRLVFGGNLRIMRRFLIVPPPSCLRNFFFPTSAATDLNVLIPVRTFPISVAAISIKSAPTNFAAETTYLLKNGIALLPFVCANAPNLLRLCLE